MNQPKSRIRYIVPVAALIIFFSLPLSLYSQQPITFGIHADPVISWFSSNNPEMSNKGARPGINFGISFNKYFAKNYSFSSGVNLISTGGRLVSLNETSFDLRDYSADPVVVAPGDAIIYKIQYLSVPLGLKLQTNQIGYITFFTDIGLDPKVVVSANAEIPTLDTDWQNAIEEVRLLNMSYHITAGIEYSVGGNTALVLGLGYDNNFLDITRDINSQPDDKIFHKMLVFKLGVIF